MQWCCLELELGVSKPVCLPVRAAVSSGSTAKEQLMGCLTEYELDARLNVTLRTMNIIWQLLWSLFLSLRFLMLILPRIGMSPVSSWAFH